MTTNEFDLYHIAAVGVASDVVSGDFCEVEVWENEVKYEIDDRGEYVPVYPADGETVVGPVETLIPVPAADRGEIADAADEVLAAHGWRRVEDWSDGQDALHARVERQPA